PPGSPLRVTPSVSTQVRPNHDVSLSVRRTVFAFHALTADHLGPFGCPAWPPEGSFGLQPPIATNSKPLKLMPRTCNTLPAASMRRLPRTLTAGATVIAAAVMLTVAVIGVPSVRELVGFDSATVNVLSLEFGDELLIGSEIVFAAVSPPAQVSMPFLA